MIDQSSADSKRSRQNEGLRQRRNRRVDSPRSVDFTPDLLNSDAIRLNCRSSPFGSDPIVDNQAMHPSREAGRFGRRDFLVATG